MASEAAWDQVREIVTALGLESKLDSWTLDNLKGRMADACDRAWQDGFNDAKMHEQLGKILKS